MLFSSGLGIDISDSSIRLARVSYVGSVLETKQIELPAGLVVDDTVVDPAGVKKVLDDQYFSTHKSWHRLPAVLIIPDSRVFDVTMGAEKFTDLELQRQIPIPVREAVVSKLIGSSEVQAVDKTVLESFLKTVESTSVLLRGAEQRATSVGRFMVNFKDKHQDTQFQAAIGAAQRAAHPWRYKHSTNFLSSYASQK
ncbi:MAG: hypothetical protein AAB413_05745 [Patescibacteria group bacterium]